MGDGAGVLLERDVIEDLAPTSTETSPGWTHFVSNEQVLRLGLAISSNHSFDRPQAIALGETVARMIDALSADIRDLLAMIPGAGDFETLSPVVVNRNEKVIVNFPSYLVMLDNRPLHFGLSATVCQGETNSKIWTKVSYFSDRADTCEQLAKDLIDKAYAFYEACAREVSPDITFTKGFSFDIRGAYSTDYAITDAFNILQRSASPKAAFQELRRKKKLTPIARLFKYAVDSEVFSDEKAIERLWKSANTSTRSLVSSIEPLSVRQSDAIVLIKANKKDGVLHAWGLCHSDNLDFDETPPVREAATQLTGKLASLLAADL